MLANDMILYIENSKVSIIKQLELSNKFDKVSEYIVVFMSFFTKILRKQS